MESTTPSLRPVAIASTSCAFLYAAYGWLLLPPAPIVTAGTVLVPLLAGLMWVQRDAKAHRITFAQDWGLFGMIAWPLFLPWYALKTRGRSGWRLMALCAFLLIAPWLAFIMAAVLRVLLGGAPS